MAMIVTIKLLKVTHLRKTLSQLYRSEQRIEIRPHLNRKVRIQDVRLQKSQALVCKAIVPQLQHLDLLLKAKRGANRHQWVMLQDSQWTSKAHDFCVLYPVIPTQRTYSSA